MTVVSMCDGPAPPQANLTRQAKIVVHMWDGAELLEPELWKLLMLRTCGTVQSCSSCAAWNRASEANPKHRVMTVERMWDSPKLPRSSLKRTAEAVADMWDGPELLKSTLSKLLVLHTCGLAPSH